MSKGKYCCFNCPSEDHNEKSLDDLCPTCGHPYGFPLEDMPDRIGEYRVIEPKGRGFYAATYFCHFGPLNTEFTLKVSPVNLYEFFGKNLEEECRIHKEVARDTEHIVEIITFFDDDVQFGDLNIKCHVTILDYVPGDTLEKELEENENLNARSMAQIAIDLFRILQEFEKKRMYHNDLHSKNIIIQRLGGGAERPEALDGTIRAVAIDLGSTAEIDKAEACGPYPKFGDQHWLCRHLQRMIEKLRENQWNIDKTNDLDKRIAESFELIRYFLLPAANAGKVPTPDELIRIVRDYFGRTRSPWKEPLKLSHFSAAFNAAALDSWYVPYLLVDPDDYWIKRISAPGPLLITGMRGCGKTMLLQALDIHARAAQRMNEPINDIVKRLKEDNYVGLFESPVNLLVTPGRSEIPAPLERLFLSYCLKAVRAVRHIKELDPAIINPGYRDSIMEAIEVNIGMKMNPEVIKTDDDLEDFLVRARESLTKNEVQSYHISSPASAFKSLANAVQKCSSLWSSAKVFFLLDDVSTRFLKEEQIKGLFSALLFQIPECAFKLTTEAQTLEIVLYSPGLVEKARAGRDYDIFDLGGDVLRKTKTRSEDGKLFIERILEQRVKYYPNHPSVPPRVVLGDCKLKDIATDIASTSATSAKRKSVYWGITALSALCVGDIGDVIHLYELILTRAARNKYPIGPSIQSQCYQDFCSNRLYFLTGRENDIKDFALTFAEASYELLIKSYRQDTKKTTHNPQNPNTSSIKRIREYSSIYVRLTAGDTQWQFKRLRELIDSGIFVLHGGAARTKTKDSNPIQQFKLIYRKLFGLSHFIGLADRDRFELSGTQLEEWLHRPSKNTLLRNLGGSDDSEDLDEGYDDLEGPIRMKEEQQELFDTTIGEVFSNEIDTPKKLRPRFEINEITIKKLKEFNIEAVILGLGFEERSLKSAKRILENLSPSQAILIEYPEPGKGTDIKNIISERIKHISILKYEDVISKGLQLPDLPTLVDVTGLAKPALFAAVRSQLQRQGTVWICHTRAKEYYPLDGDIDKVFQAKRDQNQYQLLDSLSQIFMGEKGPYTIDKLLETETDESRRKLLCTFASAKHERLLALLDKRDYDQIEIVVPKKGTKRSKIAHIAAQIAACNSKSANMTELDSNDLSGVVDFLIQKYFDWYAVRGYNLELGLVGSKLQAVACAAVSVECKVAQCWYVHPKEFDTKRFTKGVGESHYYVIRRIRE